MYTVSIPSSVTGTRLLALRISVPIDDLRREPVACGCLRFFVARALPAGASRRCFGDPVQRRGVTGRRRVYLQTATARQPGSRHPPLLCTGEGKKSAANQQVLCPHSVPAGEDGRWPDENLKFT